MSAPIIGTYEVPAPERHRILYEYAAWWCEIEVPRGLYPVLRDRDSGARVMLPGVVVSKYTQGHFGGVPIAGGPAQYERHRDVGSIDYYHLFVYDFTLVAILAGQAGDARCALGPNLEASVRRWNLPGLTYGTHSRFEIRRATHVHNTEPRNAWGSFPSSYDCPEGAWRTYFHLAPLRALPSPRVRDETRIFA